MASSSQIENLKSLKSPHFLLIMVRSVRSLAPTTAIFAIGGLGMSLTQAVALRIMSTTEVGKFVLVYGIVSVGSTAVGLGLPQLLARTATIDQAQIKWRRPAWLISTALAVVPSMIISVGTIVAFPSLRAWGALASCLLVVLMLTANLQALESSLLRACGKFVGGAIVLQGALILVTLALLVPLALSIKITALGALWIMLGAQVLLIAGSGWKEMFQGRATVREVTKWIRGRPRLLAGFWLSTAVAMSFRWVDRLTVGSVLSLHDLSTYQSLFLLTSLYDLLGIGIGYINLPRYAKSGSWSRQGLSLIFVLMAVTTVVTAIAGFGLGGRVFLLKWTTTNVIIFVGLMAAGTMKLVYAEVSAVVGALGHGFHVLNYSGLSAITLVVGVAVVVGFGLFWGLIGIAGGSLVLWGLRVIVSYRYMVSRLSRYHVIRL